MRLTRVRLLILVVVLVACVFTSYGVYRNVAGPHYPLGSLEARGWTDQQQRLYREAMERYGMKVITIDGGTYFRYDSPTPLPTP